MTAPSRRDGALTTAAGLFGAGLIAVLTIFGLAAFGYHDLPVWLNLSAMLAPLGLGVALVSLAMRALRHRRLPGS